MAAVRPGPARATPWSDGGGATNVVGHGGRAAKRTRSSQGGRRRHHRCFHQRHHRRQHQRHHRRPRHRCSHTRATTEAAQAPRRRGYGVSQACQHSLLWRPVLSVRRVHCYSKGCCLRNHLTEIRPAVLRPISHPFSEIRAGGQYKPGALATEIDTDPVGPYR